MKVLVKPMIDCEPFEVECPTEVIVAREFLNSVMVPQSSPRSEKIAVQNMKRRNEPDCIAARKLVREWEEQVLEYYKETFFSGLPFDFEMNQVSNRPVCEPRSKNPKPRKEMSNGY